jgi:phosphoserine phosphatase
MSAEEKTLDELEAQAAELIKTRNQLFDQIKKHRDERDRLNESANKLRDEAKRHREERDGINARVQEIKKRLGPLFEELDEKKEKLSKAERLIEDEYKSRPGKNRVERDLNRIEWEVMTTPTKEILDREDELIQRASRLRQTLIEYRELEKQKDQRIDFLADKKATEIEIRAIREEMGKLSEESQGHHEKMIMFYEQADAEKKKADEAHGRYVEKIREVEGVKGEINALMPQINALRDGLRLADVNVAQRRKMSAQQRMETMRQEALKKMENGGKLTFEDLRLIYGDEDDESEVLDGS